MTDSSDPKAPKNSRKKPAREPATIDLRATVIDDGAQEKAWDDVKPEETIVPGDEVRSEDSGDMAASPEANLDSGSNADSIPSGGDGQPPRDDDVPQDAPPAQGEGRRPSPVVALIGSGLLGGLIGAGIVYGLQLSQPAPPSEDDQRLAQLEQRVNGLAGSRPQDVDLSPVEGRLQALEAAGGELGRRLQEVQETANRAASRAEDAFNRPLPQPPAPQNEAALSDLSTRLEDLSTRLSALESEARANAQRAADAAGGVQTLSQRLGEQDQRLATLSQQVAESSRSAEAAGQTGTRVVLAERLGEALRNGRPYADVLEALRKTGADPETLKPLEPFAETGAPTPSAMLAGFEPLEARILRDERSASGAWSDRLLRMMDKVVTVRPVNEPGATGVPATLARIRQGLASGDMGGAAAAWAALPEPARRISEEWGRQATALAGAEQASRAISEEALATLNRSTQ